jgi:hypothetical protein
MQNAALGMRPAHRQTPRGAGGAGRELIAHAPRPSKSKEAVFVDAPFYYSWVSLYFFLLFSFGFF